MYYYKNNSGTTILELIVGLIITAILLNSAYQLYRYITMSASREKEKAELQNEIITSCNVIERDIRMAGCSIPGNGIDVKKNPKDTLFIFTNPERFSTTLAAIAQPGHDKIIVLSDSGFIPGKWVFIPISNTHIRRRIVSVKTNLSGNDTILLESPLGMGPFNIGTDVFPADIIIYTINRSGSSLNFLKIKNNQPFTLSNKIDSLQIIPKNIKGSIVMTGAIDSIALLTVVIGGHVGNGGNRVFLAESTEVNIRNLN